MSRINNDIGEIQRIAAETALAWVGNVLFLVGTVGMLVWLDCAAVPASASRPRRSASGRWCATAAGSRSDVAVLRQRSADIGSFLIETLQGVRLVVTSNAQEREVAALPRRATTRSCSALMSMQMLTYLSGGLPGLILSAGTGAVFLYGGLRVIDGTPDASAPSSPSWRTRCASCRRCRR